jgi:hypothetical protein
VAPGLELTFEDPDPGRSAHSVAAYLVRLERERHLRAA